ncbi:MAG: TraR/DksA family transcriptional regulator [Brevinema sp.]
MLTEQQLSDFHIQLTQMKIDLIETIQSELEDEKSPFNVSGDMADKAEAITYVSVNEELTAGQKNTLDKIDRAIKRIEDKIFGKCTICSNLIELDRLSAIPYAETCKVHMQ